MADENFIENGVAKQQADDLELKVLECLQNVCEVKLKDLKGGDQIAVWSSFYYHHGIYIGDFDVIDFSGEDKLSAKLRKVDMLEFTKNSADNKLYRIERREEFCLEEKETIRRAIDLFKRQEWQEIQTADIKPLPEKYHLLINNCETIATYLKTGKKFSRQAVYYGIVGIEEGLKVAEKVVGSIISSIS